MRYIDVYCNCSGNLNRMGNIAIHIHKETRTYECKMCGNKIVVKGG